MKKFTQKQIDRASRYLLIQGIKQHFKETKRAVPEVSPNDISQLFGKFKLIQNLESIVYPIDEKGNESPGRSIALDCYIPKQPLDSLTETQKEGLNKILNKIPDASYGVMRDFSSNKIIYLMIFRAPRRYRVEIGGVRQINPVNIIKYMK